MPGYLCALLCRYQLHVAVSHLRISDIYKALRQLLLMFCSADCADEWHVAGQSHPVWREAFRPLWAQQHLPQSRKLTDHIASTNPMAFSPLSRSLKLAFLEDTKQISLRIYCVTDTRWSPGKTKANAFGVFRKVICNAYLLDFFFFYFPGVGLDLRDTFLVGGWWWHLLVTF